jgi:Arc/MetJ-type ribon-helix-helix transcriptional regulator
MNINLAPVDEALLKQLVEDGHYTSVAEAVRFAVKNFLRESPVSSPFYAAVLRGTQSLHEGKGVPYTSELEDEIWQEGLTRAKSGRKPNPDVVPQ